MVAWLQMAIEAHQLLSFTLSGLANGFLLASLAYSGDYGFLGMLLGGIAGYGLMELTRRVYYRIASPGALVNRLGLLRVTNWERWIIWGALNGTVFYLLYPLLGGSYAAAVAVGLFTVHLYDIAAFIYAKIMLQRALTTVSSARDPTKNRARN